MDVHLNSSSEDADTGIMLSRRRVFIFFAVSALLHVLIFATTYLMDLLKRPEMKPITIEIQETPALVAARKVHLDKMKKVEKLDKQIVEQEEKSRNEVVPENTRFLSAKNQKVEKQTVAANRGEFRNSKKTEPQGPAKKPNFAEMNRKLGMFKAYDPSAPRDPEASTKRETESTPESNGSEASASSDYIKDVDQGLETLLNAREFKYYTYYNRIRRQLSQHWEPKVRAKLSQMFKQGRYLASATDRVTKLIVILDTKGNLVKVQMIKDSGVTDLDDAAIEAFQSAAPFPNPPKGIVDPDGTVKIRWDFVLET